MCRSVCMHVCGASNAMQTTCACGGQAGAPRIYSCYVCHRSASTGEHRRNATEHSSLHIAMKATELPVGLVLTRHLNVGAFVSNLGALNLRSTLRYEERSFTTSTVAAVGRVARRPRLRHRQLRHRQCVMSLAGDRRWEGESTVSQYDSRERRDVGRFVVLHHHKVLAMVYRKSGPAWVSWFLLSHRHRALAISRPLCKKGRWRKFSYEMILAV